VDPITPPLSCTVRGCHRPLTRRAHALTCEAGHAFDCAAAGYVNLLQPQDRRSASPGDARPAVEARRRLLAAGVGRHVLQHVAHVVHDATHADVPVVADLGCGSGEFLSMLADLRPICGVGIDLSTTAAIFAARGRPDLTWVVANADRRVPLLDRQVDAVVSIQGRRNAPECERVLKPGGVLVVAVPAQDDLVELRQALLGRPLERERAAAVAAQHRQGFTLRTSTQARAQVAATREQIADLMQATYRGARHALEGARAALGAMTVTIAADVLLFERVSTAGPGPP
jgi:23S rRNA (guanine745-N1)-methyltransferase